MWRAARDYLLPLLPATTTPKEVIYLFPYIDYMGHLYKADLSYPTH